MVVLPLSSVRGARAGQADPVLYYGQMIGWPGRRVGGGGRAIVTLVMDHPLPGPELGAFIMSYPMSYTSTLPTMTVIYSVLCYWPSNILYRLGI